MAIAADTWVETPSGRLRAYQIQPGSYVFGMDGLPTKVKSVQTYTPQQMYYVEFKDGSGVEGDAFMAFPVVPWTVRITRSRTKKPQLHLRKRWYKSPQELLETGLHYKHFGRFNYTVETVSPLNYGFEDHAVPPFVAGFWYARTNDKNRFNPPEELQHYIRNNLQKSKQFLVAEKKNHWEIRPAIETVLAQDYANPTKEFPYKYLYGTPEQRLEFLQGYFSLRSSTYKTQTGKFRIKARRRNLYTLKMIQLLCESLGIKTLLQSGGALFYQLEFKTKLPLLPIQKQVGRKSGEAYRQITKVEPCPTRPCVHLETEKPIAVSDSFIPLWHSLASNKKS